MTTRQPISLCFALSFLLLTSIPGVVAQTPFPEPSSAKPLFKERPFGPVPPPARTPVAKRVDPDADKPIPIGWYIGGCVAGSLAIGVLLLGAARAWRTSALFHREHRFPSGGEAALRFGATKCGGHMASINLGRETRLPASKAENA